MQPERILYMGTPEFAVGPLKSLIEAGANVVAVVTAPDREAGRGRKLTPSAVKVFATEMGISVLQPEKLRDPKFISTLQSLQPDLAVVVAFRMLPEVVWSLPTRGAINLHASLLPNYRGAAPINWAIINGETETGVTTFFISHDIDTGNLIYKEAVPIGEVETAGQLHDRLCQVGSALVVKTVNDVLRGTAPNTAQVLDRTVRHAPKLSKETCRIDWTRPVYEVVNLIRGLSPYPAAYTELVLPNNELIPMKVFSAQAITGVPIVMGQFYTDGKSLLTVGTGYGSVELLEVQQAGKRKMAIVEFLRGVKLPTEGAVK